MLCVLGVGGVLCAAETLATSPPAAVSGISFSRDVRPILSDNCFQCHGPDADTREADLRLDVRDSAIAPREGGAAIVPGKPQASLVIQRIRETDETLRMPPTETGKKLSPHQVAVLERWIALGAPYESHWAFRPVVRHAPPPVRQPEWCENAIDRFVLKQLEQTGIAPGPPADRHTLIRRVYLDFLGVLPSVEEADAFAADTRPDAYARLLDRVLASPRFGERWGRHWLDHARYADSHGYTNDNERVMWPYRDWVIRALNADMPFDQFTIEQLAGDLLPDATLDQIVATGFHRNTLINTEGGTKADQFHDEQVKDRVDTTGAVWLGLTVGCAKCHSHKFDPISKREYYQLYAFFNTTADKNSVAPTIKAPTADQRFQLERLARRRQYLEQQLAADRDRPRRQRDWERQLIARAEQSTRSEDGADGQWIVLEIDGKSRHGATFQKLDDKSLLISGTNRANDEYQITGWTPLTHIRSVRLEALTHPSLPKGGPGRASNGNFVLSEIWFRTGDGRELRFTKAYADHSQPRYDIRGAIDGNARTGWAVNGAPEGGPNHDRVAWFVLPRDLVVEEGHALTFTLQFNNNAQPYNLGRFRISVSSEEYEHRPSLRRLAALAKLPPQKRTAEQQRELDEAFLQQDERLRPLFAELRQIAKLEERINAQIPATMVMRELPEPPPTYEQIRGDFLRPGERVFPDVPAVLPAMKAPPKDRTRLDLARWLVRDDHPLTPRVQVNRFWMRLFGRGLVETENDFGTQGTLPTHPELLDWLASEFVRREWSIKQTLRVIAESATYRQSSKRRLEAEAVDPRNLLLARQNRVRVEAEIVRDLALSASGRLSDKIGGPSVYPPQPEGVYAFTQRKKNWPTSQGEDRFRRGMYTFFYRSAPYPMLTTFDTPKFNQTCTRRDRSNTPLQALTLANSQAMFELAQALARRVVVALPDADDAQRVRTLFRTCLIREPSPAEERVLLEFLQRQRTHFLQKLPQARQLIPADWPDRPATLRDGPRTASAAAWVAVARLVMNLDEFITRE